jgi:branched-subunit amino acid aminotransferase/4-amino-4-deoxychorismate lyase
MAEDLERADGLFITSSTRDLLPVAEVEGLRIQRGDAVRARLAAAFQQYLEDYCAARV